MNSLAIIKYLINRWNEDEDAEALRELTGNLNGEALIDENTQLPYARVAVELPDTEVQTGSSYLNNYYVLIVIYGIQDSEAHYLITKELNRVFFGKNCRFDMPDSNMHVLFLLPLNHKFENIDTIAGRDILVSDHRYKMLIQENYLNPDGE